MELEFRVAERKKVRLKIGISSPAGHGKTTSSLLFAYGLIKGEHPDWDDETVWSKIAVIDSENGSGEMYAETKVKGTDYWIGKFNVIPISAPFTTSKYTEAVELCKKHNMEVCIIDSMTHLWNGVGSLLEKQSDITKKTGNSYTAWRTISPEYNRFIDTILQTDMHVIATMRSKTEYVQEKDANNKTVIRKVGMAPVMRDGIEYEFSIFMDIDVTHTAQVTKDRTGVLDGEFFTISPEHGRRIAKWLSSGAELKENKVEISQADSQNPHKKDELESNDLERDEKIESIASLVSALVECGVDKTKISNAVKKHHTVNGKPTANYKTIKDIAILDAVIKELEELNIKGE